MTAEVEVTNSFAEFEAIFEPYTIQFRGVSLWRLLRVAAGYAKQELPLSLTSLTRSQLIIASIRSVGDIMWHPKLAANYAVKSYASALRIKGALGYEDVYFEELLKAKSGGARLHSLNAPGYVNRTHGLESETLDCTAIHTAGDALGKVFPFKEGEGTYAKLSYLISQHLGLPGFTADHIGRTFGSFWWQARIFKHMLASSNVKTVIAADSEEWALAFACRSLGIRFIELQHGVLNPLDPLCLPASALQQASAQALLLPDALALYGNYWSERHATTAMGQLGRVFAIGSSTIDRYRKRRAADFQPDPRCPRLVVTTQGLDRAALIAFLASFLAMHSEPCIVTIKLHPAYDLSSEPYAKALAHDPRVEIVLGDADPNTYELIARADLHVSIASACHFDALGIGTPTVVLNLRGSDAVTDLVQTDDAMYAKTAADLVTMVMQRAWGPVGQSVSNKYFKRDHLNNILRLMQ